ncbi:hypothetical protein [Rubripirellula lacrimiformis]|uniref:hypothetical protein n=1 Tax=Rubripirellula lacrimiformis TaxID=1930273 RepID=UPI0011A56677|nr:hypothetical protein [Rubripirellula lacrimiformis]
MANSLLYSIYFSMLGFGFVRGGISVLGYYASFYALAPALIAGFGALTHITLRPCRSSDQRTLGGEPSGATKDRASGFANGNFTPGRR